jgi:hypothetical protein
MCLLPPSRRSKPRPRLRRRQPGRRRQRLRRRITDLLGRYKAAIEGRNIDAVKRIWPAMSAREHGALRDEFRRASSISVNILNPRIAGTADAATVTFIRDYEVVAEGQQLHTQSNATMEVRRSGASWLIESIRFDGRR